MSQNTGSLDYLVEKIKKSVETISREDRDLFISLILEKKKIFIYGSGRSGLIGQLFAVRLVQLGLDVHFVGEMTTPIIRKEDLTIIVSNMGENMSGTQTANIARRIGSHVVSITSRKNSKLANSSNTVIHMKNCDSADNAVYAPLGTLFEDSVMIFFDSLIPELMEKLDASESDMRNRHAIWV